MSYMNALASCLGWQKQTVKGSLVDPSAGGGALFGWVPTVTMVGGPAERNDGLPKEMGNALLRTNMVKLGVSGRVAAEFVPRPNSLGEILCGLIGQPNPWWVTSAESTSVATTGGATTICDGTSASTSDLTVAGKGNTTSYTTDDATGVTIASKPRLTLVFTAATAKTVQVKISGLNENGTTVTDHTVSITSGAAGAYTAPTTVRFSKVSKVIWPAMTTSEKITIGKYAGSLHTFKMGTDLTSQPWYTVVRRVGGATDGFWECMGDCHVESLNLTQESLSWLAGSFTINGITTYQMNNTEDVAAMNATIDPDNSPPFVSAASGFKLDTNWKSTIFSPAEGYELPIRSAQVQIAAVHDMNREFVWGRYTPIDIDIVDRMATMSVTVQLRTKFLYDVLMYDAALLASPSTDTSWLANTFNAAAAELKYVTAIAIPGADSSATLGGNTPVYYYLRLIPTSTEWFVSNLALRGTDIVTATLVGSMIRPASATTSPFTALLLNGTANYL